jgi:uncharacterized iron-regulated membrane protein
MKKLRRIIFWGHLIAGVTAGVIILVMSVTGVLLAFEHQIIDFAEREMKTVAPTGNARLGIDAMLSKVSEARPDMKPTGLTLRSESTAAATIAFGRDGIQYLDPYTGATLGYGALRTRAFFRIVEDWHRWLGSGGENRAIGRAITGAGNTVFLILAISGTYLWWPKKWSWRKVRPVIFFQKGLKERARNFNWHNTAGFWSSLVLIVITATGMVLSYQWANNLLYRLAGSQPPPQQQAQANRGRAEERAVKPIDNLDQLWTRAEQQAPGWQSISLRLPLQPNAPVAFTIREGKAWLTSASSQLTLHPASAEVMKWEPYASSSPGRKARTWARFLHTGEAGGLPGQVLAGLASLGGSLLVWTGLALAWRRLRQWVKGRYSRVNEPVKRSILLETKPRHES